MKEDQKWTLWCTGHMGRRERTPLISSTNLKALSDHFYEVCKGDEDEWRFTFETDEGEVLFRVTFDHLVACSNK